MKFFFTYKLITGGEYHITITDSSLSEALIQFANKYKVEEIFSIQNYNKNDE